MDDIDQDVELDFLSQALSTHNIGQHELKTSPLMTKDAADISGNFAQRGLLGKVLSVHADGLPEETVDPRLYLNLNAPSSGLVCGVQGSGKSHTVSCILESSLMVDPRIGCLPAPLGTVVFHFDEENGQRPCEAAYLSSLKGGMERGVEEVVVLVSPSNLKTRRRVYSSLNFVEVHPLRIAEKDLNAARMLSMMGCDNLETLPLYLHSALSILRRMGSDDFSYQEFKQQLAQSEFNKAQGAMLQLRMDLLDSFLQGKGPDVTSFFKAGRLVIIDISDPFVEASTAAMLFDICLGLFIEWKSTTGKLIVLDEAHKYLTNADANRFTRTICSIIRQQRHLAARVIVSTQEPTVVPPSVLDLLSWIVAHRFSSPSWVGHLKRHVCVQEEVSDESGRSASSEKSLEWGRKVMMLRTGEGILFSPASVFATEDGTEATLTTGYAIIKTRPRLTSDGGESLLATEATIEINVETIDGIFKSRSSDSDPEVEQETIQLGTGTHPDQDHIIRPPVFSNIPPGTPLPKIIDIVASTSFSHHTTTNQRLTPPPPSPTIPPSSLPDVPTLAQVKADSHKTATSQSSLRNPSSSKLTPVTEVPKLYVNLVTVLRHAHRAGLASVDQFLLSEALRKAQLPYPGKLVVYLKAAEAAGVVHLTTKGTDIKGVALRRPYLEPLGMQKPTSTKTPQPNSETPVKKTSSGSPYDALVDALRELRLKGANRPPLTQLGEVLAKRKSPIYEGKLQPYLKKAEKAGVVKLFGAGIKLAVELKVVAPPAPRVPVAPTPPTSTLPAILQVMMKGAIFLSNVVAKAPFEAHLLAMHLRADPKGDLKAAGYSKLKNLLVDAESRGLISLAGPSDACMVTVL